MREISGSSCAYFLGAIIFLSALVVLIPGPADAPPLDSVALFKDRDPWGTVSNENVLTSYGISYDVFGSGDMGVVDLSSYDKIIIVSQQDISFYQEVANNRAWFESYISIGKKFQMHGATYFADAWNGLTMPGGLTSIGDVGVELLTISDIGHEMVNVPHVITDSEIDNWNYASNGYLTGWAGSPKVVIEDTATGYPVLIEFRFGDGMVIATQMTLEWGYDWGFSQILENIILYNPIVDTWPPEISNVLVNGMPFITVSQGTILTLTATASDASTGNNSIALANYTEGFANWASSVDMNASDGSFNSPTEDVEASVDTSGWTMGVHDLYVYATDAYGNGNVTSMEHVRISITIPDTWPPEILNARVNGNTWVGINEGDLIVLTATVTDLTTGDSVIAGANYTFGAQNWPGFDMDAADGSFDTSVEDVTLSIDTTGWAMANHTLCIYAKDIVPNENTTSTECVNVEILAVKPLAPIMTGADLVGPGLSDVEIRWDRSGDDGLGKDNVIEYDMYQATSFGGPYVYVTSVPATNSPTYSWTCAGCGVGDASAYFYYAEADNGALTEPAPNKASKFTQPLTAAPQLISVPLALSIDDIAFALQTVQFDMAYYYDSSDASDPWKSCMPFKTYKGDLWTVNRTMAFWVNVTSASDFVVAGLVPDTTAITLRAGWNLVGFPSFASAYTVADLKAEIGATRVEGYQISPPYYLRVLGDAELLQAGYGFWIKVEAETIWTVEVS